MFTILSSDFFTNKTAYVVLLKSNDFSEDLVNKWLCRSEVARYFLFKSEKRRQEYVFGRIAAKIALSRFCGETETSPQFSPTGINITNSEHGDPIIIDSDYAVSITHSYGYIGAVVFPKNASFGIDIERIDETRSETFLRMCLDDEPIDRSDIKQLTVAWCAKEALGKALLCGLDADLDVFKISSIGYKSSKKAFVCKYEEEKRYTTVSKIINNDYIMSICYRR